MTAFNAFCAGVMVAGAVFHFGGEWALLVIGLWAAAMVYLIFTYVVAQRLRARVKKVEPSEEKPYRKYGGFR